MPLRDNTPWEDLVEWSRDLVVVDLSTPPSPERAQQVSPRVGRFLQPRQENTLEATLATMVDQYADVVILSPPDAHVTDIRAAVAALKRVLRSGGRVVIEIPLGASTAPEPDWRAALEFERIWVDEDRLFTRIVAPAESTERDRYADARVPEEKDANCVQPCYRRLSGIK